MIRQILGAAAICGVALAALSSVVPAHAAGTVGNYHEYRTHQPTQGWVGVGRRSAYCDYIKYPIKDCGYRQVCKHGKCWTKRSCTFRGWDVRQTCY